MQRVESASVTVDSECVGKIGRGVLVYLGVGSDDDEEDVSYIARKVCGLRIFPDEMGRMAQSVTDIQGAVLLVSQFTLYGDVRRGKRPSFERAALPARAKELYLRCKDVMLEQKIPVETGRFQAMMDVSATVAGPVTIMIDSKKAF